jgi:hypothetical protein
MSDLNDKVFLEVSGLLGRKATGTKKVVCRNKMGQPAVIEVDPLIKGRPFPTIYWLICPILKKELSHLEKNGLIQKIEQDYVQENTEFAASLKKGHENYRDKRVKLFEKHGHQWSDLAENKQEVLKESGIGGIRNFSHIKCLHLHYAHHLAEKNNVIGTLIDELHQFNKRFPTF